LSKSKLFPKLKFWESPIIIEFFGSFIQRIFRKNDQGKMRVRPLVGHEKVSDAPGDFYRGEEDALWEGRVILAPVGCYVSPAGGSSKKTIRQNTLISVRFVNADRTTPLLFPGDLREWIAEDHPVHFKGSSNLRFALAAVQTTFFFQKPGINPDGIINFLSTEPPIQQQL
jgi:hypothetical protein